jgi:hypothetical protein
VGKTTVARLLVGMIKSGVVYDPERWGYVLQRLPPPLLGLRGRPQDFQDLPLWRSLIARGILNKRRGGYSVITPMAFTNKTYFDQLTAALETESRVLRVCLVAPLDIIAERLERRARQERRAVSEFERRRSQECVDVHRDPGFGQPIDATRPARDVADEIARLILA